MNKIDIVHTGKTPKIKINDANESILNFDSLLEIGRIILDQLHQGTFVDFEITASEVDILYKNAIVEIIASIKNDSELIALYNETRTKDNSKTEIMPENPIV